jgi:hypothetical protein
VLEDDGHSSDSVSSRLTGARLGVGVEGDEEMMVAGSPFLATSASTSRTMAQGVLTRT